MAMVKHFKELTVWQKADALAHEVFDLTEGFPRIYLFDLTNQLRRAALSVPNNIVEGSASSHKNELLQSISIARRSIRETQYLVLFSKQRNLIENARQESLTNAYEEVHRMLNALTYSLRRHHE